jgi:ketosteroid isomerase-like protein
VDLIDLVSTNEKQRHRAMGAPVVQIDGSLDSTDATVHTMNLDAIAFSERWMQSWNAHDVEAVLRDFHDDVLFTSPVAAKLLAETDGVIRGKHALRRYWTIAVESIPDLRFVVEGVYQGIDTIVIAYRNQNNDAVNEVLKFRNDLVIEGHGAYLIVGQTN